MAKVSEVEIAETSYIPNRVLLYSLTIKYSWERYERISYSTDSYGLISSACISKSLLAPNTFLTV